MTDEKTTDLDVSGALLDLGQRVQELEHGMKTAFICDMILAIFAGGAMGLTIYMLRAT